MQPQMQCGHTVLQDRCTHCAALQAVWYTELEAKGFEEIENVHITSRPLKTWTGTSIRVTPKGSDESVDIIDLVISQAPGEPVESSFPGSHLSDQERFFHCPAFEGLCESLCGHGNHLLKASQVRAIWLLYIAGDSNRKIGTALSINDTLVWRTINTLTQWMELMDLDETQDARPAKVVLRDYRPSGVDGDRGFIYATWRNALWFDNENRKEGESDQFFRRATRDIRTILNFPVTRVRIACLDDSDILIVGYSVTSGNLLHFVYVKPDYRCKGIGTLLVPKNIDSVSPVMTKIGRAIAIKKKLIQGECK